METRLPQPPVGHAPWPVTTPPLIVTPPPDLPAGGHADRALFGLRAVVATLPVLRLQLHQDLPRGAGQWAAPDQRRRL